MLLARTISYADAHRARLGVNYKQIPVNEPRSPVNSYTKGGAMRMRNATDPVYAPNTKGGAHANPNAYPANNVWEADGAMVRAAYTLRKDDGDFNQANDLVNKVMNDEERERLVHNAAGHLSDGVGEDVLQRAFEYWRNVDANIGERIEKAVRENLKSA